MFVIGMGDGSGNTGLGIAITSQGDGFPNGILIAFGCQKGQILCISDWY